MLHFLQKPDKPPIQSALTNVRSTGPPISRNYVATILDEVALEGLDGITIPMLHYRLKQRQLTFKSEFLLKVLQNFILNNKIHAFIIPNPRPFSKPFTMADFLDAEGTLIDPEEDLPEPYPFCVVDKKDVLGSCSTFHERKLVTQLDTIDDEDSVVFVASQEEREKALYGTNYDPLLSRCAIMNSTTYAILERIGRSREQGKLFLYRKKSRQNAARYNDFNLILCTFSRIFGGEKNLVKTQRVHLNSKCSFFNFTSFSLPIF